MLDEYKYLMLNSIEDVKVSVLVSSVVDHWFKPQSAQTKNYDIDICCFSANHTALRSKSKDWLARNRVICPNGETRQSANYSFSKLA